MRKRVLQELLTCSRLLEQKERGVYRAGACPCCGKALDGEALERERDAFYTQKAKEIAYLRQRMQLLKEEL